MVSLAELEARREAARQETVRQAMDLHVEALCLRTEGKLGAALSMCARALTTLEGQWRACPDRRIGYGVAARVLATEAALLADQGQPFRGRKQAMRALDMLNRAENDA